MSNITTVFDACTIINLIHIDNEDEFLIKKLKHLNVSVSEFVYQEVNRNAYTSSDERDRISQAISKFLKFKVSDNEVKSAFGNDFFSNISTLSQYSKKNGEFFSTALSVYITQTEPTKLFFFTDDFVAKKDFSFFYDLHQIGAIKDTSDLLLLLYRLDDNFSKNELIKLLSSLFSKYSTDVSSLLDKLRKFQSSIPSNLRRDKSFNQNLRMLIKCLEEHSFEKLNAYKDFFLHKNGKKKYRNVYNILKENETVFQLENTSNDYLEKLKKTINHLRKHETYKFAYPD